MRGSLLFEGSKWSLGELSRVARSASAGEALGEGVKVLVPKSLGGELCMCVSEEVGKEEAFYAFLRRESFALASSASLSGMRLPFSVFFFLLAACCLPIRLSTTYHLPPTLPKDCSTPKMATGRHGANAAAAS